MPAPLEWETTSAPTLADFERMADAAWRRLPKQFRDMCGDLVIRIEELAEDDVLRSLGIESPFDLMGLYHGVSLDKKSVMDVARQPDMVFLYRRAILDYWAEETETLGHLITHVLVHEIGHHFGFSDADMEAIEAEAARGSTGS